MKKQKLDVEKLIQEVMGFQGQNDRKIDKNAMDILETMQLYIDLVRKHLNGDLAQEVVEPRIKELLDEIDRLGRNNTYWWLRNKGVNQ
ncbi:hypothetical protein [Shimazuella alba]|uniref:Uncharacterized protein n=1 Tax=Shimazuella alba TaxID=2690964 RepID=A0A6I4VSA4_9BACL|nr:hypothetical protein [Shimazuella alba]MXQ53893.1 hypothetical protein [Shimazuella alba]